jgi:ABC-type spermidine/putrescine transport system permease subunit I
MTEAAGGRDPGPPAEAHAGARQSPWRRYWPFAPAAVVLFGLFFVPLAIVFVYSFWSVDNRTLLVVPNWTLDNYATFFDLGNPYLRTFGKTILMAVLVTATGLLFAFPFAYFLVRYLGGRWQRVVLLATILPFWTSYLVRIYAWQSILGEQGAINGFLKLVGLISEPLDIFVYNDVAVFIVLVYLYFPFAALALYTSFEKFDFTQLTAAQDLGATPARALVRIMIPQVRPGVITACIFVFIPVLGEYLTPTLVGGTKGVLIGNLVYNFYRGGDLPAMAAASFLIAAVIVSLLVVFRRYLQIADVVTRT